jgi:hypothetical protein
MGQSDRAEYHRGQFKSPETREKRFAESLLHRPIADYEHYALDVLTHIDKAVEQLYSRQRQDVGAGFRSAGHKYDLLDLDTDNLPVRPMQTDPTLHAVSARGIPGCGRHAAAAIPGQQFLSREQYRDYNQREE